MIVPGIANSFIILVVAAWTNGHLPGWQVIAVPFGGDPFFSKFLGLYAAQEYCPNKLKLFRSDGDTAD